MNNLQSKYESVMRGEEDIDKKVNEQILRIRG